MFVSANSMYGSSGESVDTDQTLADVAGFEMEKIFLPGSLLHSYLCYKLPTEFLPEKASYSLSYIMSGLATVVRREHLRDPQNGHMILADFALETALGVRSLHTSQLG